MGIISQKLRASAAGKTCSFQIPSICNHNPETSVLCHAPSEVKGMGSKGHDFNAAFGCSSCHEALDNHRLSKADEYFYWMRGMQRTWTQWVNDGLIIIPIDPITAKTRPKKKSNFSSRPLKSANTLRKKHDRQSFNELND